MVLSGPSNGPKWSTSAKIMLFGGFSVVWSSYNDVRGVKITGIIDFGTPETIPSGRGP